MKRHVRFVYRASKSEPAACGEVARHFSVNSRSISPRRGPKVEALIGLKTKRRGLRNELLHSFHPPWQLLTLVRKRCVTASWLRRNAVDHFYSRPGFARLGTDTDNIDSQSECTEEQKECARRESQKIKGLSAAKTKLIRLDDLIPKQDVKGGQQLLFGVTDTTQSIKQPTTERII